jgi:ribosomal protein S18 acetylase RimI-like enzyme
VDADLRRVEAFCLWWSSTLSERTEPWRFGTALFDDRYPDRWDSNYLRVERALGTTGALELAEDAERVMARFRHRQVVVLDDEDGERLAGGFAELGWEADRLVYMVLRREPDRPPSPMGSAEVDLATIRPVIVAANLEGGHGGVTHADARMLADFRDVLIERIGARFFTAIVDGEPAGYCELYVHDGVAQIEDVNTLPRFRNRGAARAAVSRAIAEARAAGADLVFLIADANGWPRQLYGKLGFDPAGYFWQFVKPPVGPSRR